MGICGSKQNVTESDTQPQRQPEQPDSSEEKRHCQYYTKCKTFLKSYISEKAIGSFFDMSAVYCYCGQCNQDFNYEVGHNGVPPAKYGMPLGWVYFPKIPSTEAKYHDVYNQWHIAYHGTKPENVEHILSVGDLLMPGDTPMGADVLRPPEGHLDEGDVGEDHVKRIYFSPSIVYSGLNVYAPPSRSGYDAKQKQPTFGKTVIGVHVEPSCYKVGPETLGLTKRSIDLDKNFDNTKLEWSTVERGSVKITGLYVAMGTTQELFTLGEIPGGEEVKFDTAKFEYVKSVEQVDDDVIEVPDHTRNRDQQVVEYASPELENDLMGRLRSHMAVMSGTPSDQAFQTHSVHSYQRSVQYNKVTKDGQVIEEHRVERIIKE